MENIKENFKFKKEFGQNFIFDKNFLSSLIRDFNLPNDTNVVEIGAGMGTLSSCLASNYKKVVSFEIDKTLREHLTTLQQNYENLSFVFDDILNQNLANIEEKFCGENYYLIANLPYYITSQIIFKFLFDSTKLCAMFVMVQKEVGERYCAKEGNKIYGIPSVLLQTFGNCRIVKNVGKKMFTPMPKVDSCVIKIELDRNKFKIENKEKYIKFVNSCFKMKRKTLYNNLASSGFSKEKILQALSSLNLRSDSRPEMLSAENYVNLYNLIVK